MHARLVKLFASCGLAIAITTSACAKRYVTEEGVQIDRCASAWFISRFVDAEAEFVFFPAGTPPPKGVTYAFYGADYFRVGAGCTYTTLLKAHALEHEPALRAIDAIANDTVAWRQGPESLALAMREGVDQIREAIGHDAATYEQVFSIFDLVYLKAGGMAVAVQPRLRTVVGSVEAQLLSQWLSSLSVKDRLMAVDSWTQALGAGGISRESWEKSVSGDGIQMPSLGILLDWAEHETDRFPAHIHSQIMICQKIRRWGKASIKGRPSQL